MSSRPVFRADSDSDVGAGRRRPWGRRFGQERKICNARHLVQSRPDELMRGWFRRILWSAATSPASIRYTESIRRLEVGRLAPWGERFYRCGGVISARICACDAAGGAPWSGGRRANDSGPTWYPGQFFA